MNKDQIKSRAKEVVGKVGPLLASAFVVSALAATGAFAKAPPDATGECKDGTFTEAKTKDGACSGHKGVKDWFAVPAKPSSAREETAAPTPQQTQAPGPSSNRPVNPQPWSRPTTPAAGGGEGKVWVNTRSHVYHCSTDVYYGKTKQGEYMTEAQAKASGAHADHGKLCS